MYIYIYTHINQVYPTHSLNFPKEDPMYFAVSVSATRIPQVSVSGRRCG